MEKSDIIKLKQMRMQGRLFDWSKLQLIRSWKIGSCCVMLFYAWLEINSNHFEKVCSPLKMDFMAADATRWLHASLDLRTQKKLKRLKSQWLNNFTELFIEFKEMFNVINSDMLKLWILNDVVVAFVTLLWCIFFERSILTRECVHSQSQ